MPIKLQNPLPRLKAIILPNCSRIGWPPCPAWTFFSIIVSVLVSIRQAAHWPQDSAVKNSEIFKTSSTMQVPSVNKRTTPHPKAEPASRMDVGSKGVSSLSGGRKADDGAAGMTDLIFRLPLVPPPHCSIK